MCNHSDLAATPLLVVLQNLMNCLIIFVAAYAACAFVCTVRTNVLEHQHFSPSLLAWVVAKENSGALKTHKGIHVDTVEYDW